MTEYPVTFKTRAMAKVHGVLSILWCALVIPSVVWIDSPTWLLFMLFGGVALILMTCHQVLAVVKEALTESRERSG